MNPSRENTDKPGRMNNSMDMAIRLAFVALIIFWCTKIIAPFFLPVLWGVIISVAFYPIYEKLRGWVGGREKIAGVIFIVGTLALVLVPTIMLSDSLIGGATYLKDGLDNGTLTVPPPSDSVKDWPAIGDKVYESWLQASQNLQSYGAKHTEQVKSLASFLAGSIAAMGGAVVQTSFSLIIAGILLMNAMGGGRIAFAFAERLGGENGRELVTISIATIRSVVRGVLLVAMIQGLMSAVGLVLADVPGAGFWALLVMIVAIMQLPPILILGPIAAYVFSASDSTVISVMFLIWSLVVSMADGFLKPIFLGRGVAVPMLVILIGAIGGMLAAGIIGLFIGAVILALGYKMIEFWMEDGNQQG